MDTEIRSYERDKLGEQVIAEASREIRVELVGRFEKRAADICDLARSEQIAILSAIEKALAAGYQKGVDATAEELKRRYRKELGLVLTHDLKAGLSLQVPDRWAELYEQPRTIGDAETQFDTIGDLEARGGTIGELEDGAA